MADKKKMDAVRRRMVQVSPQEMVAANEGETDEATKTRYKREMAALNEKIRQNESDSRFYKKLDKVDPFTRAGAEIERKIRKKMGQKV